MKKAQILSALALAFALGVVAPVSGVIFSADTYAAESRAVETATKQEVLEAVSKVENYGPYKSYKTLIDAVNAYNNDKLSDGTTKLSDATITSLSGAIADAVDAINGTTGTTYVDLDAALAAAGRVSKYSAYNTLYGYMEKDNNKVSATDLRNAILGVDNSNAVQNATKDMIVSELKNFVNTNSALSKYSDYADLIEAVADANTYKQTAKTLEAALNDVKEWTKNDDGKTRRYCCCGCCRPS